MKNKFKKTIMQIKHHIQNLNLNKEAQIMVYKQKNKIYLIINQKLSHYQKYLLEDPQCQLLINCKRIKKNIKKKKNQKPIKRKEMHN